jgi:hypothetical protein
MGIDATAVETEQLIDKKTSKNTKIYKELQWMKFRVFKEIELSQNTRVSEIVSILRKYAGNMRRINRKRLRIQS